MKFTHRFNLMVKLILRYCPDVIYTGLGLVPVIIQESKTDIDWDKDQVLFIRNCVTFLKF